MAKEECIFLNKIIFSVHTIEYTQETDILLPGTERTVTNSCSKKEENTTMILREKERTVIEDLQTQEKSCIEKYGKYAQQAKDPELRTLFRNLQQKEREHYDSLSMVLSGNVPECDCNDTSGRDYQPKATYTSMSSPEDKQHDAFLATDSIGTEKLVSGTYNNELFAFGDSGVRRLLADIQIEEQNHAEMLYKYKTVNGMS